MDPSSPTTTPVWDAKGKLNNVVIAEGRGNTKKLAKNDGAKRLVIELQEGLSRARVAQTIPYLAKQLVTTHLEKVKNQRDKRVEVSRFDNPCPVEQNFACEFCMSRMQNFAGPYKDCRVYKMLPILHNSFSL